MKMIHQQACWDKRSRGTMHQWQYSMPFLSQTSKYVFIYGVTKIYHFCFHLCSRSHIHSQCCQSGVSVILEWIRILKSVLCLFVWLVLTKACFTFQFRDRLTRFTLFLLQYDPFAEHRPQKIAEREDEYKARRRQMIISPERLDPFADGKFCPFLSSPFPPPFSRFTFLWPPMTTNGFTPIVLLLNPSTTMQ